LVIALYGTLTTETDRPATIAFALVGAGLTMRPAVRLYRIRVDHAG